jgi:hypothetical protein
MDSDKFCYSILSKYPILPSVNENIGVFGLLFGLLYVFNTGLTVYWIMHQRFNAELGVERAARHVSTPLSNVDGDGLPGGVPGVCPIYVGFCFL